MTMTPIPTLTADEIKALRRADSIVFRFEKDDYCRIDATIEYDPGDGFGKRDLQRTIHIREAQTTNYVESDSPGVNREITHACWVFSAARFHPQLVTMFSLLRPGDQIRPHFVAGDHNGHVAEAGLRSDTINVLVHRRARKSEKVLTFRLDTTTYPREYGYANLTLTARPEIGD